MKKIDPSEITSREFFENRRNLLKAMAVGAIAVEAEFFSRQAVASTELRGVINNKYIIPDALTPYKDVTGYNNFYEFTTSKEAVASRAVGLKTENWKVSVEGLVKKPKVFDVQDLIKLAPIEERIYRMRCVEGWSMVIPWEGYSLSKLLAQVEPIASAKYVVFVSEGDKRKFPGGDFSAVEFPYIEGLRLDEAMHPLTLLALGLYGEILPNQNGAPVRVVVPWKYGFKSPKSIVKIILTDKMPITTWNAIAPNEYGFYANVNPDVAHPRWSQATERRIGSGGFFSKKIKTLPFNGYADEVSGLYTGMDLKKFY